MFEKNINNLYNLIKSSFNPYISLEFREKLIKCFSIILLFLLIAIGTIGGCGGSGGNGDDGGGGGELAGETNCSDGLDNDGDTQVDCADIDCILDPDCPECEEIVAILCDRADECGFVLIDECVVDFVFNDLGFDCEEFLAGPFNDECMEDMDDFDCDELGEDILPESCGDELIIPEIQVPPRACEDLIEAQCNRQVECDSITFDECKLVFLFLIEDFFGFDCSDISEGPTLDECLEDLDDFDCDLINDGFTPDSCTGVLVPN